MRSRTRKHRRLKPSLLNVARSMGKWKPQDDFQLIQSVIQLNDLSDVHEVTKFTRKFSLKEIRDRWNAILYDAPISRMIYNKIKKLHPDDVLRLKRLAPFSESENQLLIEINKKTPPQEFENFLKMNKLIFHESRTASSLECQWNLLKDMRLLNDQDEKSDESLAISLNDLDDRLDDTLIRQNVELSTKTESAETLKSYDSLLHEIKRAEADVFLWQILVDKVTNRENPFADVQTLAVIFSEKIEFKMNKKEISIGRSSSRTHVDFDLSLVNKTDKKISRKQCIIYHVDSSVFFLVNKGQSTVFVDGCPVLKNERIQLNDKCLIEINDVAMLFLLNYNIVSRSSEDLI